MVSIPCCIDHLKTQPAWIIFLSSLAFFSISMKCMLILQRVFRTFIRPAKDLKTYGSWAALVTGSTDGIGMAFVFKLAEKGLNLVLVSRNPCRLKQISSEIQAKYPEIEVKILELEFSSDLAVSRVDGALKEMIQGLNIGVLINNVGIVVRLILVSEFLSSNNGKSRQGKSFFRKTKLSVYKCCTLTTIVSKIQRPRLEKCITTNLDCSEQNICAGFQVIFENYRTGKEECSKM